MPAPLSLVLWPAPAFAALVLLAGCQPTVAKKDAPKPPEVKVAAAKMQGVTDYEDFTGTLEASKKVDITSRVTGYLEEIHFKEGGQVKKGQVLFEIDPRPMKAEYDRSEAAVVQAQARLNRLTGDLRRAEDLLRSRSTSKEEFEKIAGDYEEAKAAVGVAAAARKSAELNLGYTKVISPISGRVGKQMIDEGNLVKADSTILAMVVAQDPIYAYFDVDERTFNHLQKLVVEGKLPSLGLSDVEVGMELAAEKDFPRQGKVDFEDNTVDPATGTKRLRAVFDNKNGLLAHGMFCRIRFQVGQPRQAVVVREEGVGADQGQKFVYLVTPDNKIEYRKVTTGPLLTEYSPKLRVIESGLAAGDRIVVEGLQRVRPKMAVDPKEAPLPDVKTVRETPVNLPTK